MRKIIKFTTSILLIIAFAITAALSEVIYILPGSNDEAGNSNIAYAQAATGQEVFCRGDRDFSAFISSTISFDGFLDYWKDILIRYNANICHYFTIDTLVKRLDKARKKLREAFYVCANTPKQVRSYFELEAELFFVRNYIDTDHGNFFVTNEGELFNEFTYQFRNQFTSAEILVLIDKFKAKYTPKLDTYRNCKDPTWEDLVLKWNEFKESAGGIAPALKQAKRSIEKRWDKMESVDMNLGRKFIGGWVDATVNDLPALEGLEQIWEEAKKNFPEGYTFEQFQADQDFARQRYDYAKLQTEYVLQYQTLYLESSNQFSKQIIDRLETLNKIIVETHKPENQTIQCVRTIAGKQC